MENELERAKERLISSFGNSNFGDVLVVGGGISGIQASLDLAAAGFKVYLVDKAPSIGGIWPSWTRPFPPMTVRCEFSLLNWSRSAGIPISKCCPTLKLTV